MTPAPDGGALVRDPLRHVSHRYRRGELIADAAVHVLGAAFGLVACGMLAAATLFVLGIQGLGLAVIARSYASHLGLLAHSPRLVNALVRFSLERGLVLGGLLLLGLFALLVWRILRIGWQARDTLGSLVAAGLAGMILFQVLVNVGMVIGIMPITGIPLPFVTHGGASLVSMAIGLGILQSVNIRQTRAEW